MNFGKAVVMLFVTVVTTPGAGYSKESKAHGSDSTTEADARVSSSAVAGLVRVEAKYVCMPNNKRFEKEQIPVEIDNKMYYDCCKMCVSMSKLDPKVRLAVDPIGAGVIAQSVDVRIVGGGQLAGGGSRRPSAAVVARGGVSLTCR